MPSTRRISVSELEKRLRKQGYNVPPILCNHDEYPCVITDPARAILTKKLSQKDKASKKRFVSSRSFRAGLDYSSSEDEDTPTPIRSRTREGRHHNAEARRRATSITTQASPKNSQKNTSYILDTKLVSFLILCLPAVFILVVSLQYL